MHTDRRSDGTIGTGWPVRRITRRGLLKTAVVSAGVVLTGQAATRAATAADKITITQWYHEYGEAGTQQAVMRYAQEYTKANPNVQIQVGWNPGDYTTKLNTALVSGNGPDVFEVAPNLQRAKSGQIAPLDSLYTPDVKKDFAPVDIQSLTIEGKIYGVKMVDDTGMVYYRKSLLDKAGVKPPTNMQELAAAAKTLTKDNVKGLFLGNDGGISAMLTILPWSAGSSFIDNNQVTFNNARTVAAFEALRDLNAAKVLLTGNPTDWFQPDAFIQGLVAMQWGGLWAMPAIKKALGDDFGVMPWPAFDAQGTPATFLGGWAEQVNPKGKNVEEAMKFVKWLWIDNTAAQKDFNLSYGFHVPPRLSLAAQAEPLKSGAPAQAVDILHKNAKFLPPTWDDAMTTALTDAVTAIVKNNTPAAQALKTAADKCSAELQKVLA